MASSSSSSPAMESNLLSSGPFKSNWSRRASRTRCLELDRASWEMGTRTVNSYWDWDVGSGIFGAQSANRNVIYRWHIQQHISQKLKGTPSPRESAPRRVTESECRADDRERCDVRESQTESATHARRERKRKVHVRCELQAPIPISIITSACAHTTIMPTLIDIDDFKVIVLDASSLGCLAFLWFSLRVCAAAGRLRTVAITRRHSESGVG